MIRERYSLLISFILFEISQNVCYGNDSFNSFNNQHNKNINVDDSNFSLGKILSEDPLEGKFIEKRRLFIKENDLNSPVTSERQSENDYWGRRRTNYSEIENDKQISEHHQVFNNWENGKNRVPVLLESGNGVNFIENPSKQPFIGHINSNQQYDWKKKTEILDKSQSLWNEEKNLKQYSNPRWNNRIGFNNNGKHLAVTENENNTFSEYGKGLDFSRRAPITTLSNAEMGNIKNYHNERVSEMPSGYVEYPNKNYFSKRHPSDLWDLHSYRPEKGVIINFNTDCLAPRQFHNQLVHKLIFAPKTPISTHSEVTSFRIPDTAVISAPRITPMYYL